MIRTPPWASLLSALLLTGAAAPPGGAALVLRPRRSDVDVRRRLAGVPARLPSPSASLFGPVRSRWSARVGCGPGKPLAAAAGTVDDAEEEGTTPDWRDFRAQLVRQYQTEQRGEGNEEGDDASTSAAVAATTDSGKSWAYDSGNVIERGSVILSRPEQDFGYGLRQQYFHKCVILVLEHDAAFTRGIILNRPTDLILSDEDFVYDDGSPLDDADPVSRWRVWFGGDVRGLFGDEPEVTCLHSLRSEAAAEVSEEIIKDIRWTTLAGARKLVTDGEALPEDFWVFCGYAGWDAGQLTDELERESWYMAATDSGTLLEELKKQERGSDPRDAGLGTWEMLMGMIGRGDEARKAAAAAEAGGDEECEKRFDDLMLREWARERLVFSSSGGTDKGENGIGFDDRDGDDGDAAIDDMIRRATESVREGLEVRPGAVVRASSAARSPFLLDNQEFHKSTVLILQDDAALTVGVLLNLPSAYDVNLSVGGGGGGGGDGREGKRTVSIPQRYGGRYGVKGQSEKPFVWLHCSDALRDASVGSPIGGDPGNIWICTQEDAAAAIGMGLASPTDFLVVNGFSVWEKTALGAVGTAVGEGDMETAGGMRGEVWNGHFEVVPHDNVPRIWELLSGQELLTASTMGGNIERSNAAWESAVGPSSPPALTQRQWEEGDANDTNTAILVYKSQTSVQELANAALRSWIATFLLGDPNLRGT